MALTNKPFLSILDGAPTLLQTAFGINQLNKGLDLQLAGYNLATSSFRNAGVINQMTAQYNAQLEELSLKQRLNVAARQVDQVIGNQKTTMATSGFALSSKSFLQVANDSLATMEREIINLRNTSAQKQQAINFAGKVASYQAEANAKQSEYAAEVAKYQSDSRKAEMYGSAFKQVGTLIGGLFNGNN